ncbi:3-keto-5-aminohexanoate cleavage enzyme [Paraburkholderia domus]|uniref:3-keto-5-aminohexanoate cleavage protein n=1 Tax=Paraburkholderia domus TaxID=2793075 RepID=UPI00191296C9|nr:3-keto-5-aminohexanoate cleavage protein [Paraburkholderia domus]MBK5091721.1 3-keto-5-aminohexanoate cleavage protein [Burkholderia sp. R-69927]CAE6941372.1 3-keto-5-aminohexanoate cleavage enzyme [Paraburkholderia domus]
MKPKRKVIISCAITGSIHTPSMSPYLPVTPGEIAQSAIGAANAGASIVHLHARRPEDGFPTQHLGLFREIVQEIRRGCDAIVNLTTGGSAIMTLDERLAPALELKPELASLNMGSMNFGLYQMLGREREFKHAWERPFLEGSRDLVFRNTFADIENILRRCGENGTRFEFECYDTSHLYNLAHFVDRGLVKGPFFVQNVFGLLGGIGTHPEDISHMKRTADRLFGNELVWSVLSAGKTQTPTITMAALLGGNVRVGLEDSLWDGPGQLAPSNAAQVTRISSILNGLSLELASPQHARETLALKGADTLAL